MTAMSPLAQPRPSLWDRAGVATSALCVTHCVATPLLATALPVLAATEYQTHLALTLALFLVGLLAFVPGRRSHGSSLPLRLAVPGFAMLFGAVALPHALAGEGVETALTMLGGGLLITAHLTNLRYCRCCRACAKDPSHPEAGGTVH